MMAGLKTPRLAAACTQNFVDITLVQEVEAYGFVKHIY